jgi:hypothetical protein
VQQKVVHAGVNGSSFEQASRDLAVLADLAVAAKPIERLVKRIGGERIDQRDAAVAAHRRRPLMEKDTVADPTRPCPAVAMVSMDGGRLQMRSAPEAASMSEAAPLPGPSQPPRTGHWRESKVAVLETYLSTATATDPDPDVPRCFLDLKRTAELVRGLGHALPTGLEFPDTDRADDPDEATPGSDRAARPGRPARLVRSVLASRARSDDFGPMLHQAARERNFFGAPRRAFLGDGLATNWTTQRRHFPGFTPVLDFVHALSYIFAAAFAGRPRGEGRAVYERWIQAAWSGEVATILPELAGHAAALGVPPPECAESDPRRPVSEALGYLENNAGRMRYDAYRREGLPIMTSAVESVIKMINRRVKGSEKFWSEEGAEAVLQLRADSLSETEVVNRFWSAREGQAGGTRPYRRVA